MVNKKVKEYNNLLVTGEVYHVFSKSIAGFKIFKRNSEFLRMRNLFKYYEIEKPSLKFSYFLKYLEENKEAAEDYFDKDTANKDSIVNIMAYCIMPTHIHLILKQTKEMGISTFMNNVLNSYTRYFNTKYKRKGPLWEGRFKRVRVRSDEQILHLTRYIHLNPVTAYLVNKPEKWSGSSYEEYITEDRDNRICRYDEVLDIEPGRYKKFVEGGIDCQRELAKIKHLFFGEIK